MLRVDLTVILLLLVLDPFKRFFKILKLQLVYLLQEANLFRVSNFGVDSCMANHFDVPDHLYDPGIA